MSDSISRQAAIDTLKENMVEMSDGEHGVHEDDIETIINHLVPPAQPDWIPCSERLPEFGSEVLVCYDFKGNRSVYIANFYGDGDFHGCDDEYLTPEGRKYRKAVAWMPLPEPYAERREDD